MKRRFDPSIDVSIVIPCYNEEENAEPIARAVIAALESTGASFELIFIDNDSSDSTVAIVKRLCAADARIKLIANSRNFGQMRSPTYGIYQAQGRAVIGMCADFQDPPALLPEFIERWRQGVPIVLGVRESEAGSARKSIARSIGYGLLDRFADYRVIPNATGFGLYDRKVVDVLAGMNEPEPFFRGMLVESGFRIETIPFARPMRAAGISKNNFSRLLDFYLSSLGSSSKRLLRLPFYFAAFAGLGAGACAVLAILAALFGSGFATPLGWIAFAELHFAILCGFLGMIGEQMRLVAERSRNAPLVIERERVNLPPLDGERP